ncbi:cation:proton antiporter [Alloyangia pacifica]|uniref:Kef-type potassium/proton antiporter, CPA2 family n=1 Tax=Alloyangia pacifica TaxID=311180 RepID=A0A1I6VV16_9RHOB|nr:cation:proton antiporter [Alloyangia pacifica]SDI24666.1 Kef-type potassium/proton antiporter, CPA2 family [Alloyangia pacifica]SFT17566.1 Kef-type potassium/proton antiporter, CPA2 family [Alloyangia pacifica]
MTDYLMLVFILLFAGVVVVPIATRFGLGSVLGYLLAGVALSPLLETLGVDVESVQHLAEFGVVMMLFLIGLELRPVLLWRMRGRLLGLGGSQFALTALVVGAILWAFGQTWQVGLAVGLVLALSSTAIVLQTLNEKGLMQSDGGQASFSVLLFQDIAVIPTLALMPFLSSPELLRGVHGGEDHDAGFSLVAGLAGWQAALVTLAAVAVLILFGRWVVTAVLRYIAQTRMRELFTAAALMIVLGVALLMSMVGLSPALGTFLAGVLLSGSEYRHELEADLNPFRGLLLGVFFMTVGAGIDFALLFDEIGLILVATLGLIALKAAVLWRLGQVFGIRGGDRWMFALGLAQAGEFGFVLLAFAVAQGVLPEALEARLLLVVALSMLLTPGLFILYERGIAPRFDAQQKREADEIEAEADVIIAGHGRVGGIVNRMLRGLGYKTTVIDYSAEQLEFLSAFGIRVYFGDATRPDLLDAAGIAKARLLVIAIDDKAQTTELVSYVTRTYPEVHVIARAFDRFHTYELWAAGCRDVIRETYDSSLRTGRSALEALGMSPEMAERRTRAFETLDRKSMLELAQLHRLGEPNHENPEYTAKAREMQEMIERQLRGVEE